jgi:hypothetical protein
MHTHALNNSPRWLSTQPLAQWWPPRALCPSRCTRGHPPHWTTAAWWLGCTALKARARTLTTTTRLPKWTWVGVCTCVCHCVPMHVGGFAWVWCVLFRDGVVGMTNTRGGGRALYLRVLVRLSSSARLLFWARRVLWCLLLNRHGQGFAVGLHSQGHRGGYRPVDRRLFQRRRRVCHRQRQLWWSFPFPSPLTRHAHDTHARALSHSCAHLQPLNTPPFTQPPTPRVRLCAPPLHACFRPRPQHSHVHATCCSYLCVFELVQV